MTEKTRDEKTTDVLYREDRIFSWKQHDELLHMQKDEREFHRQVLERLDRLVDAARPALRPPLENDTGGVPLGGSENDTGGVPLGGARTPVG